MCESANYITDEMNIDCYQSYNLYIPTITLRLKIKSYECVSKRKCERTRRLN